MKLVITKRCTPDEEIQIEVNGSGATFAGECEKAFTLADQRHWTMSNRIIAGSVLAKGIAKEHPKAYQAIVETFELLTGQRRPDLKALEERGEKAQEAADVREGSAA